MLTRGRYRLIPVTEVDSTPNLVALREQIANAGIEVNQSATDFEDDTSSVLAARFIETELSRAAREWKLALPAIVMDIFGIRPGKDKAVIVPAGRYIEVWEIDTFNSALDSSWDEMMP